MYIFPWFFDIRTWDNRYIHTFNKIWIDMYLDTYIHDPNNCYVLRMFGCRCASCHSGLQNRNFQQVVLQDWSTFSILQLQDGCFGEFGDVLLTKAAKSQCQKVVRDRHVQRWLGNVVLATLGFMILHDVLLLQIIWCCLLVAFCGEGLFISNLLFIFQVRCYFLIFDWTSRGLTPTIERNAALGKGEKKTAFAATIVAQLSIPVPPNRKKG